MHALILILNQTEKLDVILEMLYKLGAGATTIDSVGMGKVLLDHNIHTNIFASLKNVLNEGKPYNKTLISVMRDKKKLDTAVDEISTILDIDNTPGAGFLFIIPVLTAKGGHYLNS